MNELPTSKGLLWISTILLCVVIIAMSGCFGLFDSSGDIIVGKYNVGWIDVISSRAICLADKYGEYGGGVKVPAYVYAVGHNDRFIVAKQHPLIDPQKEVVDTRITNYFIIDMSKDDIYRGKGVSGPLTKVQFDSLCKKYDMQGIEFDKTYPENL